MNRNSEIPQAVSDADVAQLETTTGPGAELADEVVVSHDTTLKWIVVEEALTPATDSSGAELSNAPSAADAAPVESANEAGATPAALIGSDTSATPASVDSHPVVVVEIVAPAETTTTVEVDVIEPVHTDDSEGPSETARTVEIEAAAEAAPIPAAPDSSDSDGMLPQAALEESSSSEAHYVEMEVLVVTDSTEAVTAQEMEPATGEGAEAAKAPTPPPIPVEAALHGRPGAPSEKAPAATKTPVTTDMPASVWPENPEAELTNGEVLPEALARRPLQKRSKPWYEEVFDEDYLRTVPFMTAEQTEREVRFIRDAIAPPAGGEVLDVACGYGRHALELAQQGLRVTGLDLSLPMLIRAADNAQKRGLTVNFVHADMREMTFHGQFDAAYCVLSSFGYFDEETNLKVASGICKALKPGGRFLIEIINRDYIVRDLPSRVWWEGDGCVVLEEVDFNYQTSRVLIRRSVAFGNGRQVEQDLSIRAYSLHELGKLLRQSGFRVLDVSGGLATKSRFFGAASRSIIALCERPT